MCTHHNALPALHLPPAGRVSAASATVAYRAGRRQLGVGKNCSHIPCGSIGVGYWPRNARTHCDEYSEINYSCSYPRVSLPTPRTQARAADPQSAALSFVVRNGPGRPPADLSVQHAQPPIVGPATRVTSERARTSEQCRNRGAGRGAAMARNRKKQSVEPIKPEHGASSTPSTA